MTYIVFGKDEYDIIKFTIIFDVSLYETAKKSLDLPTSSLIYCESISNIGVDHSIISVFLYDIKNKKIHGGKFGNFIHKKLNEFIKTYE
jgi:hypothetical protein